MNTQVMEMTSEVVETKTKNKKINERLKHWKILQK